MYSFEIESEKIKFARVLLKEGKFFLSKLGVFKRPITEKDGKLLEKLLHQNEESIIFVIPRREVSVSYHSFPSQKDEEINQMARYQALRQFPYKDFNILHSANILSKMSNGYTKVMLAVVGEEALNKYVSELTHFILPNKITINSLGVVGFYKMIRKDEDRVLIDIDNRSSNLCIIGGGKLLFCREINKGFYFIKDNGMAPWLKEVSNSIAAFNKEKLNQDIKSLTILGPRHINFMEDERASLPFDDVEFIYQEKFISKEEDFQFFGENSEEIYSLIKLLGLSFIQVPEFDLIPLGIAQRVVKKSLYRERKRAGIYFVLAALICILIVRLEYKREEVYLGRLKSFIDSVSPAVKTLETRKRINQVFLKYSRDVIFLDLFKGLVDIVPDNVLLRRVDYEKNLQLVIEGISSDANSIYDLYENIKQLHMISKVEAFKIDTTSRQESVFYLKLGLK
ncbi:MAG: hypothetical protein P9X27_05385 [Candidatus Kaelpia aquatica]|nr:hypothetical protein [Candidatus Kaelpia aquatica]